MKKNDSENKRIGIVGWWFAQNYGSVATYYALYKTIESFAATPIFIDCNIERKGQSDNIFSRNFMEKHARISKSFPKNELYKLNDIADIFILGSDQVWTPGSIKNMDGFFFFLDFVDRKKKKIAYAASFGQAHFTPTNEKELNKAAFYIGLFDNVSVRESQGVHICKDTFNVDAEHVLDPVFLLPVNEYDALAKESKKELPEEYILTYTLDPTDDKRNLYLEAQKNINLPLINIIDGRYNTIEKNAKKLSLPNIDKNVSEQDWINYFKNASFVITDSHHGLAMAIIYNKPFICYANKSRGLSRFESLLNLIGLSDRLVFSSKEVLEKNLLKNTIDYDRVNKVISKEAKKSMDWLQSSINAENKVPRTEFSIPEILDSEMCTGCSCCVNICPTGALSLEQDDYGFYISKVSKDKCIKCGKCTLMCPAITLTENHNREQPDCYAIVAKDEQLLMKSSSGGSFSVLAEKILEKGGYVVGAAWDGITVKHIIIEKKDHLEKLRKSKYIQSYIGNIYQEIKKLLEKKERVLFSGCPCQVAGLSSYLGKEYDTLILVDLFCGNAPSPLFFKKYYDENFPDGLSSYEFRYKGPNWKPGWGCREVLVTYTNGNKEHRHGGDEDDYQYLYHNKILCPVHCEKCHYQTAPRKGDISIGDFWGINKKDKNIPTKQGVSVILSNNEKGDILLSEISEDKYLIKKQVPFEWIGGNGYALKGTHNHASPLRNYFFSAIKEMSFSDSVKKIKSMVSQNKPQSFNTYTSKMIPLLISNQTFFNFNQHFIIQEFSNKQIVLKAKNKYTSPGNYITVSLSDVLKKNKKYLLYSKFYVKTDNGWLNFNIKKNDSKIYKSILAVNLEGRNDGKKLIEVKKEFIPEKDEYNELMIGISQLSGENSYLAFEHIEIVDDQSDLFDKYNSSIQSEIRTLREKIEEQEIILKTQQEKNSLLWQSYKKDSESWDDAKKRFFRNLPKAKGDIRLMQLAILIQLLYVDRICKEHNIEYWLSFGGLLGAVRNGHCTPWDDDIDICMMRDQFELFRNVMDSETKAPVYLREGLDISKRNLNKIYQLFFKNSSISCCLDIFIYDYCVGNIEENKKNHIRLNRELAKKGLEIHCGFNHKKDEELHEEISMVQDEEKESVLKLFAEFQTKATQEVCLTNKESAKNIIWSLDNYQKTPGVNSSVRMTEIFPLEEMKLEGFSFPVPKNAESYCIKMYGDIYTLPDDMLTHRHKFLDDTQRNEIMVVLKKYLPDFGLEGELESI